MKAPVTVLLMCLSVQLIAQPRDMAPLDVGKPASQDLIHRWNTAIQPDGRGLPPGQGCVSEGKRLYAKQCAACHGEEGKGGVYDVLVGRLPEGSFPFATEAGHKKTIGNYWPWPTTLFDYIRRAMPFLTPGTLSDAQTYSLCAYLLHLNDLLPENACLDADKLPKIVMPAQHRFVPDNRLQTSSVR
ncbi:cytochrome c [Parendozoicomonas sp. Alg238-R29]|uniref:c-type cytochrome n=1 Tax=Parendozoicomonas sp. Alg238-R29 TaxID=2993446 RepID=UPI00248D64EE|nr:cytochrome c [Parendozoicomonas sp. Alg238-R29]